MELFIFARFHAREGREREVAAALHEVATPTRAEPGCVAMNFFRSVRDPRVFFVHSHWVDEAAFETHIGLPHTVRFVEKVEPLIGHPLEVERTRMVG